MELLLALRCIIPSCAERSQTKLIRPLLCFSCFEDSSSPSSASPPRATAGPDYNGNKNDEDEESDETEKTEDDSEEDSEDDDDDTEEDEEEEACPTPTPEKAIPMTRPRRRTNQLGKNAA